MVTKDEIRKKVDALVADTIDYKAQVALAIDPGTTPQELDKLSKSRWPDVRTAVASRTDAPISALERLAEDPTSYLAMKNVWLNPSAPPKLREKAHENYIRKKTAFEAARRRHALPPRGA